MRKKYNFEKQFTVALRKRKCCNQTSMEMLKNHVIKWDRFTAKSGPGAVDFEPGLQCIETRLNFPSGLVPLNRDQIRTGALADHCERFNQSG